MEIQIEKSVPKDKITCVLQPDNFNEMMED